MQIIFGRENAKELQERYLVVELETFHTGDRAIETFCVVPTEAISFADMPHLESYRQQHQDFLDALNSQNYAICKELYPQLKGRWKGELDSFYDTIMQRIKNLE